MSKAESLDAEKGAGQEYELPTDTESPRKIVGFKWFLVVTTLLSSIFLFSLDNTVVADLVPIIVNSFHHVDQLVWLSVGFIIGAVVLALSFGQLYATFDGKWLFIISTVLFQAASALCGGAPNMSAMIIGRVLAGVGGNGMYLGTLTLMILHTREKERSGYLALIGVFWGLGTVLGPVVGGGFAIVSWRWAFFINPMIGAFCLLVCVICIPASDPIPNTPYGKRFAQLDYVGSVLITAAITTVIMAISFGGTSYAWSGGETIALFVVSSVLFIAFGIQQTLLLFTSQKDRVFPTHFLRNRNAVLLFICAAACNTAGFIPIYYIPIYFQFSRGDTAIESAVRLLPLIFLLSATVFTNGQLMVKYGSYQDWYIVGSILLLIGGVLMSRIDITTSTAVIYGYEVLLALGSGAFIQAGYTVIYLFIKPEDGAYGVSFMSLGSLLSPYAGLLPILLKPIFKAQLGGIAIGLSIAGAVFVNRALVGLAVVLPNLSHTELQSAVSGTSGSLLADLPEQTRDLALNVIVNSLRKVFIPVYVGAVVCLICSVFLTRKNIGKIMAGTA